MENYDFCGWATRNDLRCSDGRVIRDNAFKDCDGKIVPLVYNHQHDDLNNVLGHALLKNVPGKGVLAYGTFNDSEEGQAAKVRVAHKDLVSLSIYANHLKQNGSDVIHGSIKEVSLVLAGANPGAYIETVLTHADGSDDEEEGVIWSGIEDLAVKEEVAHADSDDSDDNETVADVLGTLNEKQINAVTYLIAQALDNNSEEEEVEHADFDEDETIGDVFDTLSEKQKLAVYALIAEATKNAKSDSAKEDTTEMKHNVFENDKQARGGVLSHSDQETILNMAKSNRGSFRNTFEAYMSDMSLRHDDEPAAAEEETPYVAPVSGFESEDLELLFPEYRDLRPGAPELITYDQGWIDVVMRKISKSPFSRLRTRQVDIRAISDLRAKGYKTGTEKAITGNYQLIHRTTDPQTVYVKNALNRDDITDITDFDYVAYQYKIDRLMLNEEIALAIMVGDEREDDDPDKIHDDKIRPIWTDDELYTIHTKIDLEATAAELQGEDTTSYFGENFIYAEGIVNALLYAREGYKGSGKPDFFCDPHVLNVMLLARDRNGHRLYNNETDLARALNVGNVYTVEQFADKVRTTGTVGHEIYKKLLGIVVNLADYSVGSTKGGQITHFNQFDIDFNLEKSLIETRLSGTLTRIKSAIVLEEEVDNP